MQRFFVEPYQIEEEAHRIHINGTDVNHIKNVLRMKCGEDVWISDGGDKEYHCQIEELGEDEVLLHILYAQEPEYELPNKLYLFQGLPKADKMELIIQKAVELGVYEIIPVAMKNCVVKLDAKKVAAKTARWQGIAESAAKQSKRSLIPKVTEPMSYKEAVAYAEMLDQKLVPYENERGMAATKEAVEAIRPGESIGIFIGPEGGFAPEEIAMVKDEMKLISLGSRILRTETAGFTTLAILMYHIETSCPEQSVPSDGN